MVSRYPRNSLSSVDRRADPSAYGLGGDPSITDPRERRLNAQANFGVGFELRMPFMTEVAPNLWHGGVETGLVLPEFVDYTLALSDAAMYVVNHELVESRRVNMQDDPKQELGAIPELGSWVNERRANGPVFVHCQAGINRSSLVIAAALIGRGEVVTGQEAIDLIREKRDAACLCNPAFEAWVRDDAVTAVRGGAAA